MRSFDKYKKIEIEVFSWSSKWG